MSKAWWVGSQSAEMPRWCWALVAVAVVVSGWELARRALDALSWLAKL